MMQNINLEKDFKGVYYEASSNNTSYNDAINSLISKIMQTLKNSIDPKEKKASIGLFGNIITTLSIKDQDFKEIEIFGSIR